MFQTEKFNFFLFNRQNSDTADVCINKSPLRTMRSLFVLLELLNTNLQQGETLLNSTALRDA